MSISSDSDLPVTSYFVPQLELVEPHQFLSEKRKEITQKSKKTFLSEKRKKGKKAPTQIIEIFSINKE